MNRKKKNAAQQRQTSRELIDIQKITEYGLLTSHGELVFFSIEPTNLSVHSPESIGSRIYALMTVLKGMAEIEMLALNSKESFEDNKRHYSDDLLTQTAGRSGEVGSKMMILLMAACDHFGSESYLLASKLAVKTGDVERLRFLMDQAETYILEMEPGFVGRMIRDAYSLNPYIGREMMDYATNEQIAAAPAELMLAAVYNRDSRAAFTLARKGIDITGRASEVIRQYAQRGDTWELEQLIRDGMKIQPTNLSALKACIQADLLGAAKLLLEKGTDYEKFLSWTKTIGYDLPAAAAAELSEHWEQLDLGRAQGQDPGMGGMSLG